ncbi:hypothetical protein [uncultured Slackia sp.]|uniref:hypothetical protein n=1 Tax=uncultured Slackia sp. TaxID=665903 RepID=UPI0025E6FB99|nr:hypothetical protein [uncultured Slackia sp.]
MEKKHLLELANDYANEADELEAGAINAAEVAIASIKAGELEEALDLLKAAAENVKGAAIDRTFQKQNEEAAEKAV